MPFVPLARVPLARAIAWFDAWNWLERCNGVPRRAGLLAALALAGAVPNGGVADWGVADWGVAAAAVAAAAVATGAWWEMVALGRFGSARGAMLSVVGISCESRVGGLSGRFVVGRFVVPAVVPGVTVLQAQRMRVPHPITRARNQST